MKPDPQSTFKGSINNDENAQRFRAQATGIGQTRAASQRTGAVRAQVAIDCAPPAQLKVKDRSYPTPTPVWDPATERYVEPLSGRFSGSTIGANPTFGRC